MKNLLTLHEAIVIALININKENFTATFDEIADFIDNRGLYTKRKGEIDLAKQIMLRATKSKGNYSYLFEQIDTKLNKIEN